MGTVYEAEHLHLRRRVAIKTVSERLVSDPHTIERFRREMEALGRLVHPHVVQAYDAGEIDGLRYLAMEFIDGVDVEALAAGFKSLPIADCCEIIRQAALGLHHAHSHGLTHRDVKPRNLLLGRDGTIRVADLGLARMGGDKAPPITQIGNVMGTYDYISPEQVAGEGAVGPQSDLYSLGCTLYRLLAGAPPFSGPEYSTPARKLMAHVQSGPPPIGKLRPDVAPQIVDLVERLMAKDPARRPKSAADVAAILEKNTDGAHLADLLAFVRSPGDDLPTRSTVVYSALQTDQNAIAGVAKHRPFLWRTFGAAIGFACLVAMIWANRQMPRGEPPIHFQPDPKNTVTTEMPENEDVVDPRTQTEAINAEGDPGQRRWRGLLGEELKPILWNRNTQSFFRFDREADQLFLRTDGLGILGLGEAPRSWNTLQLDVQQLQWNGGFGVAVESAPSADGAEQFIILAILKNSGTDRKAAPLIAESKRVALRKSPTGSVVVATVQPGGVRSLPDPGLESQLLELRWDQMRITRVRWAGIDLSELVYGLNFEGDGTSLKMQRFGIFVERTELTVSAARWLQMPSGTARDP